MAMDPEILNVALGFAMAFGDDWLRPVHDRLARDFPLLTSPELDAYDVRCREVMSFANTQVPILWRRAKGDQSEAFRLFERASLDRYDWISIDNLKHLFSQGCYYAHKNGELDVS